MANLKIGSSGNSVKDWQKYLNTQGYNLKEDGIFGSNTEAATKRFQKANGLTVDGIVGSQTLGVMNGGGKTTNTANTTTNVGSAPTGPQFNTNATAKPDVGSAPTGPAFNTTATDAPTLDALPTTPTFNTTATPGYTANPLPTAPKYDSTSWDDTEKGQAALGDYNSAKDKVNNYGDFTYEDYMESDAVKGAGDALNAHLANKPGEYQSQWQSQLDGLMNQIMNREKFSYDLNGDALYQQYKDKYIQQGKLAMADTMGQAAAMTGGYGSSYAQSVGQQAYQGQLDNLNDVVPELYQMALDRYNQEGQNLYNQYGLVMDRENTDYGRYRDTVSDWNTDRGYLTDRYDTERGFDYSKYIDDRNLDYTLHQEGYNRLMDSLGIAQGDYYNGADMFHTEQATKNSVAGQEFNDAMNLWGAETDQGWKQAEWDEAARQYANSMLQQGFENDFNLAEANNANKWKEAEWDEAARQYANSLLQQGYQNQFNAWEADSNNAWKEYQADEAAREYANSLLQQGYQNEFNAWGANNDEAWKQKEWDREESRYQDEVARYNESNSQSNAKDYVESGGKVGYNNGALSSDQVKEMQKALGINVDGKWGSGSTEAAGGLTADQAWKAYQDGKLGKANVSYADVEADIKYYLNQGAGKDEISAYLSQALKGKYITQAEYNKLKAQYLTLTSSGYSGGGGAGGKYGVMHVLN